MNSSKVGDVPFEDKNCAVFTFQKYPEGYYIGVYLNGETVVKDLMVSTSLARPETVSSVGGGKVVVTNGVLTEDEAKEVSKHDVVNAFYYEPESTVVFSHEGFGSVTDLVLTNEALDFLLHEPRLESETTRVLVPSTTRKITGQCVLERDEYTLSMEGSVVRVVRKDGPVLEFEFDLSLDTRVYTIKLETGSYTEVKVETSMAGGIQFLKSDMNMSMKYLRSNRLDMEVAKAGAVDGTSYLVDSTTTMVMLEFEYLSADVSVHLFKGDNKVIPLGMTDDGLSTTGTLFIKSRADENLAYFILDNFDPSGDYKFVVVPRLKTTLYVSHKRLGYKFTRLENVTVTDDIGNELFKKAFMMNECKKVDIDDTVTKLTVSYSTPSSTVFKQPYLSGSATMTVNSDGTIELENVTEGEEYTLAIETRSKLQRLGALPNNTVCPYPPPETPT